MRIRRGDIGRVIRVVSDPDAVPDDLPRVFGLDIFEMGHDDAEMWIDLFSTIKGSVSCEQ